MSIQDSKQVSDVKIMLKTGVDGIGIADIEKTGETALVDTYTITMDDGTKYTFTVTNGKGIDSITKTDTQGLVDTYTITFNDGTTSTFTVTNGKSIVSIAKTGTQGLVDTYTITFNDGDTTTFTVTNGETVTSLPASSITYDNTSSGLTADDSQEAIDELASEKLDKTSIANNLTTTTEGSVLDARQGKALNDNKIDKTSIANNLTTTTEGSVLDARQGKALNDNLKSLGTIISSAGDGTNKANNTALASISVPAGIWAITGFFDFPSASPSDIKQLALLIAGGVYAYGKGMVTYYIKLNSTYTVELYNMSGGTLTAYTDPTHCFIQAVKVGLN